MPLPAQAVPAEADRAASAPEPEPPRRSPLEGWRTALREFVVIVAGVLCALAAQAWWEGRQERERERAYLVQLLADTEENERRLARAIDDDSEAVRGGAAALKALDGAGPVPSTDSLARWIELAGRASDPKPLTGTYRALLGTGDLRLVRNDSLRARLVAYAAGIDNESQRLQQLRGMVLDNVGPFVRAVPFVRQGFVGGGSALVIDVERLRRDPEVATVLFTMHAANSNRLNGLRRAHEETRQMLRALKAEPLLRAGAGSGRAPAPTP